MKTERVAECSPWSIMQYFWPALSNNLSFFWVAALDRFNCIISSQYTYMHTSVYVSVKVKYTTRMSTVQFDMLEAFI